MVGEVFASLGAFKTMFDMARALKDINDGAIRNGAVIELQEQILGAQVAQAALLERVSHLEAELARFETWDTEKQRYELKEPSSGAFVYSLKSGDTEQPHWICANCYQQGKKSILQSFFTQAMPGRHEHIWNCPACSTKIDVSFGKAPGST